MESKLVLPHKGEIPSLVFFPEYLSRIYYFTLVSDKKLSAVRICGRQVEVLIFFWDPLTPVAHDHDVKALLRVASLYNVILATNPKTANIILQELSKFRIG